MNIRIYQISMIRDKNNVAFASYENLAKWQGTSDIDSTIYNRVFEGNVDCKSLEDVYVMFNRNHPEGYKARSLSKSDVVEVIESDGSSKFHYCDTIGYKEVDFEPEKTEISNRFFDMNTMKLLKILLIEPNKYPRTVVIDDTLEAMQKVVGGDIEEYMPFEDEVAIICNEEEKINGLTPNRAIYAENNSGKKEMIEIMCGTFFIVHAPYTSEKFLSLPDNLEEKYREKFKYPEKFLKAGNEIVAIPFKPNSKDKER